MPQVVGLDIGSRSVKAALFERGFRGLEFSSFLHVDFDPADPESLGRALSHVAEQVSGSATVVTRLPGDRVILRFLEMPIGDPRKLDQVIPFEVESLVPYELDELVIDHLTVKRNAEGGAKVLVAAARREEIRALIEQLAAKGLDPRFVGAGSTALSTLGVAIPSLGKGVVALVDAGFSRTDLCVLADGKVAFVRTISGGIADLADAHVSGGGAVDEVGAIDVGSALQPQSAATLAAAEFVAREIRRTLLGAETESGVVPERIVLFGGLARMRGFAALVERTTKILVEPLSFQGSEWTKTPIAEEAEAGAAVALAFRSVADSASGGLSFRRDEFAFKRDVKELSGILTRALVAGLALLLLAVVNYGVKERLLAREKSQLDKNIAAEVLAAFPETPKDRLREGDAAVSIMRGNVDEASARLSQLGGGSTSSIEVLRAISEATPQGMYIDVKEFELSENKVRMKCVVDSYEASDKMVEALKKVKLFANVDTRDTGTEPGSNKRRVTLVFDVAAPAAGGEG